MKKAIVSMILMMFCIVGLANPNEKVLNNFSQSFPNADSVKWYTNDKDFEVHFNNGNVKCRLWYNQDGSVIKSIRYYKEETLPPMILSSVQYRYKDKKIFGITELTSHEGVQYFIVLEDDKKWYDVTSDAAGNLSLTKKFNKG